MSGVAQQGHHALGHLGRPAHGRAVAQRPQAPATARIDHAANHLLQRCAGARQRRLKAGAIGRVVPVFQIVRRGALHDDHEVLQLAPAHRVLHPMQARPQPGGDLAGAQRLRQRVLRHQGAVGQVPGHARALLAQQLGAGAAPQAVRPHQGVALHFLAPAGAHRHHALGIGEAVDGVVQMKLRVGVFADGGQQQAMQVGAVDGGVSRAVALHRRAAQGHGRQLLARERAAHPQTPRKCRHILQRALQAPGLQAAHHIGPELHACAHLAESGGTFIQAHLPPGTRSPQGCGQPANAAPRDQHLFSHDRIVPRATGLAVRPAAQRGAIRSPPAAAAARTAKCRRRGSSPLRSVCRCAA